jgi:hypothetical protein
VRVIGEKELEPMMTRTSKTDIHVRIDHALERLHALYVHACRVEEAKHSIGLRADIDFIREACVRMKTIQKWAEPYADDQYVAASTAPSQPSAKPTLRAV